jgi:hypothetical protein
VHSVTVSRLTQTQARRITYQGNTALAGALAQMLREEGVRVDLRPAEGGEERDQTSMAEAATVALFMWGTQIAVTAAVDKFRKRFPGAGGSVTIEGDDGDD